MRGEVLISVNIPISHFPLSLTHSAVIAKKVAKLRKDRKVLHSDAFTENLR